MIWTCCGMRMLANHFMGQLEEVCLWFTPWRSVGALGGGVADPVEVGADDAHGVVQIAQHGGHLRSLVGGAFLPGAPVFDDAAALGQPAFRRDDAVGRSRSLSSTYRAAAAIGVAWAGSRPRT